MDLSLFYYFLIKRISKINLENNQNIQKLLNDNKNIDPLFLIPQLPNDQHKNDNKLTKKANNKHDYLTQKRENEIQELKVKMELIRKDIEYVMDLDSWDDNYLK